MAKAKAKPTDDTDEFAPAGDLTPATGDTDEFAPAGDLTPATGDTDEAEAVDPRDAEIERLRAELAEAKAAKAEPVFAGKKYTVALKDAPKAVVQCEPGEHPWDAYKRVTGVINSVNAPVVTEAPDDAALGIVA